MIGIRLILYQLAIDLATHLDGEVINGDAMQMYDGLPILTNKINVEEQQCIPHHLLGFIGHDEEPWVVGMFRKQASKIIREIRSRGRLPIVVGGTHYYTQSLLFEDSLAADNVDGEEVRTWLSDQEISEKFPILDGPTRGMIDKLKEVDAMMADRWHPNDRRKIRRSLEIFLLSGRKASDIYAEQKNAKSLNAKSTSIVIEENHQPLTDTLLLWVHSHSDILKERLDERVDKMLEAGLLNEVKSMQTFLHKQQASGATVDETRGIWVSIGWKEFEPYLAALQSNVESQDKLAELYETSIEQIKAATRQYAKRQVRWIRLKLLPALSDRDALRQLYLLDGTDVSLWADGVSIPAIGIAKNFLAGEELQSPHEMSAAAKQSLAFENLIDPEERLIRQECEICKTVCVREEQWQAHLNSRRHRSLFKKRQRNPNGISSLPQGENKVQPPETS